MLEPVYIDFEFKPRISHNALICAVARFRGQRYDFWLWDCESEKERLRSGLLNLREQIYLNAFGADTEAACFIDLGLDPLQFRWLCSRVEMLPHAHGSMEFALFARQFARGEFKEAELFEASEEDDNKRHKKSATSLVASLKYFCEIDRSATTKYEMIEKILEAENFDDPLLRKEIIEYCAEDVQDLEKLECELLQRNMNFAVKSGCRYANDYLAGALKRSYFCAITAHYVRNGLPIDTQMFHLIEEKKDNICREVMNNANENVIPPFYEYTYPSKKAEKENRDGHFVCKQENLAKFIHQNNLQDSWPLTEKSKRFSMDSENLKLFSSLPEISRLQLAVDTNLKLRAFGPAANKKKKRTRDYIDFNLGTQHPYYGIFGTITSRNAATATSFLMLQASWIRTLLRPPPGHIILSLDYASQEIWISACLSHDHRLMDAYESGDVYLHFGRAAGIVPASATKASHPLEREICKQIVLGLGFGMGKNLLAAAAQISLPTAEKYIAKHYSIYEKYYNWRRSYQQNHEKKGVSVAADGFLLLDNRAAFSTQKMKKGQHRAQTTGNWPVQTHGAVIMRASMTYCCLDSRLKMICPVHDENIGICKEENLERDSQLIKTYMQQACNDIFPTYSPCRVNISSCGHDELYVEEKGVAGLKLIGHHLGIIQDSDGKFIRNSSNKIIASIDKQK